jgi:hypothetical protein
MVSLCSLLLQVTFAVKHALENKASFFLRNFQSFAVGNLSRCQKVTTRPRVAEARAADIAPVVKELQAAGCESLRAIASGLDERGIPAAQGGKWSSTQVMRLLGAAGIPFGGGVANGASVGAA